MSTTIRFAAAALLALALAASPVAFISGAAAVETLKPVAALPAHIAGQFEHLSACRQAADGSYFVFDRRAHSVYTASRNLDKAQKLIEIGTEPGRLIDPTAFDLARDDTFVVADAPHGRPRIQIFTTSGSSIGSFYIQGRAVARVTFRNTVLDGLGAIEYTGRSLFISQPELNALIAEYSADGRNLRTFGTLRRTGHENDRDVHLALNSGLAIANPRGGFYFVFLAGVPQFRKYDAEGKLLFERHIEGVELDDFIRELPTTWKRGRVGDGEIPLVMPSVYAAAADPAGNLWISLAVGFTYVYDASGEKRRTIQFRAAGPVAPTGMSFTPAGRLLISPGCFEFDGR